MTKRRELIEDITDLYRPGGWDELEKSICEGVVSSVAHFGFGNDKDAQLAWLKIADEKYGLTVRYYIEGNEDLATAVSGNAGHPFWVGGGGDVLK